MALVCGFVLLGIAGIDLAANGALVVAGLVFIALTGVFIWIRYSKETRAALLLEHKRESVEKQLHKLRASLERLALQEGE